MKPTAGINKGRFLLIEVDRPMGLPVSVSITLNPKIALPGDEPENRQSFPKNAIYTNTERGGKIATTNIKMNVMVMSAMKATSRLLAKE